MRGLIVMPQLPWPMKLGGQLYAHHLIDRLIARGRNIHALVFQQPDPAAQCDWPLARHIPLHVVRGVLQHDEAAGEPITTDPTAGERRWARYWGWSPYAAARLGREVRTLAPDWVLSFGLGTPALMTRLPAGVHHIWCAHDEPALHHLSLLRSAGSLTERFRLLRDAAVMALYQRAHRRVIHAAVAVAPADAQAMRWLGGLSRAWLLRTGIDRTYWSPADPASPAPRRPTAIFWGNLSFRPNLDAVRWFARCVWPDVRRRRPDAEWRIVGRGASDALRADLAAVTGASLVGEVEDIRPHARDAAITIVPVVTGTGIKTKLLEAAAMARPVVATRRAVRGLAGHGGWITADRPAAFADAIIALWADPSKAAHLGKSGLRWAAEHHDWDRLADAFERGIESLASTVSIHRHRRSRPGIADTLTADRPAVSLGEVRP